MRLYYTTKEKPGTGSQNPSQSLGGYMSSSEVSNDTLGNLFGEVSMNMMKNGGSDFRAIVLVNDSEEAATDVVMWFSKASENPDDITQATFYVGAVEMVQNELGEWVTPSIPNGKSRPYNVNFTGTDEESPASLGDIPGNAHICIWIERKINTEACLKEYDNVAVQVPGNPNRWQEVVKETVEKMNLNITWN